MAVVDSDLIEQVAGYIGAEVRGLDLCEDLDDETLGILRRALVRHKVLFFHGQHLGHEEHVAFSRRFGTLTPAHPNYKAEAEDHPEVHSLRYSRFRQVDEGWHTDITPAVNPPMASVLRADVVPDFGGDTIWTNLVAAYDGLSGPLQRLTQELRAVHRYPYLRPDDPNALCAEHPVVRRHPESGELGLFVNPLFTSHIVGLSGPESRQVLSLLYSHLTSPKYTVRLRWRTGSVAMWDNRATAHLAPGDLEHLDVERQMYRVTIEGDIPVGPDGSPSTSLGGSEFKS